MGKDRNTPYIGKRKWYDKPTFDPKEVVNVPDKDCFRYKLEVNFKERNDGSPLIAICMNPSKADNNESDTTVNHLIKHAYYSENNYSGLVIFNVHPKYETESEILLKDVSDGLYSKELELNLQYIEDYFNAHRRSDVLIAWGSGIGKVLGDIIKAIVAKLQETNCNILIIDKKGVYPPHPLYAPKNDNGNCFNVIGYNEDIESYLSTLSNK